MTDKYDIIMNECVDLEEELEEAIFHGDIELQQDIFAKQTIARTKLGLAQCSRSVGK